jgi:hypothetical protein
VSRSPRVNLEHVFVYLTILSIGLFGLGCIFYVAMKALLE